jgi:hypothetical protein
VSDPLISIIRDAPSRVSVVGAIPGQVSVIGGTQGPSGASGSSFTHYQMVPAATWVVNHNFGVRPNVSVLSVGGASMLAEVLHISTNQVQVIFDDPQTGLAICS